MNVSIDSFYQFQDLFSIRPDNFSRDGLKLLYDFLNEIDENYSVDVIALCCEFTEVDIHDLSDQYDIDSVEALQDRTTVVGTTDAGTVVFANY